MKRIISLFACTLAFASVASAASISDGRYNLATESIDLDVVYGGGCKEHQFKIVLDRCQETYPVHCVAKLVDLTQGDFCEAIISRRVSISLEEAGLTDRYFSQATLEIVGDPGIGSESNEPTRVTVRLPAR